jgi:putative endonuclease
MGEVDRGALGQRAEQLCAEALERRGYRVRDRNWRTREGELDIVAENEDTVCFVEVRMRTTDAWGDPSSTVSRVKQQRVIRAALRYLQRRPSGQRMIRFDVMTVVGQGKDAAVEHLPAAFDAGM